MPNKLIIKIAGLHCRACELLTEEHLEKIEGIKNVEVNYKRGEAKIIYEGTAPDLTEIDKILKELGYSRNTEENKTATNLPNTSWLSTSLIIAIVYLLISRFNFGDLGGLLTGNFSWPLALLVGLVAGVSTCLALVGGLVLGLAANYAQNNPTATAAEKFRPHLFFNAGRVAGFFFLGGLLGLLGSTFKLSPLFNGLLTILVGLVILILGLKLLEIFPALNRCEFSLPKKFGKKIKHNNSLLLGALTFFLPCGFTQAMQIYALSSGNFWSGGLIMTLFALGTVPGLLSLGGLASLLRGEKTKIFFKITGGIIVIFALINLTNGWKLVNASASFNSPVSKINVPANNDGSSGTEGTQIIRLTESGRGYSPRTLTVNKGKPVRLIIDAQAPYSCASSFIIPSFNIQKQLQPGENIIEFTPTAVGNIPFSCSMGMYTGNIEVKD